MENIVFDRNYELVSEDNSFADAVYKQITAPDGFFASFTKKMDAIHAHRTGIGATDFAEEQLWL